MPMTDKRERLIYTAADLFHRQGYHRTTFADVAEASGVPMGNIYYYYKTKGDLAAAVIDQREAEYVKLRAAWEGALEPRARLRSWLDTIIGGCDGLVAHGCPFGGLSHELDKEGGPLADKADATTTRLIEWSAKQFRQMGLKDPHALGVEFVARMQGVILVAGIMRDAGEFRRQMDRVRAWLDSL
ncbi:MAG: TetR/AcrR family transcriptional regulator [Nitrospirota bacterium]|nr:TetR/AcrR family transcriptional regulator [Nitrospirota bacterium]